MFDTTKKQQRFYSLLFHIFITAVIVLLNLAFNQVYFLFTITFASTNPTIKIDGNAHVIIMFTPFFMLVFFYIIW